MSYTTSIKEILLEKKEFTSKDFVTLLSLESKGVYRSGSMMVIKEVIESLKEEGIYFSLTTKKIFQKISLHEILFSPIEDRRLPEARELLIISFLLCGSMGRPKKSYHLEFVSGSEEFLLQLQEILQQQGFSFRKVKRKNRFVLYCKNSEEISTFLYLLGAIQIASNIDNMKIVREIKRDIKQMINFEVANQERTIKSAEGQMKQIQYIIEQIGLSNLSEDLVQVAQARLDHPEFSLQEIAEEMEPRLSKSAVRHRMDKLKKIYDELVKEEK